MAPKEIDLENEPQAAQVWDDSYVKNTTWQEWTIMAEDFLLETYGDGKPGKARRGLTVEIAKATLPCPQNLEGCAISTSVRKLHNRIRRIQRLRTLEHHGSVAAMQEAEELRETVGDDYLHEQDLIKEVKEKEKQMVKKKSVQKLQEMGVMPERQSAEVGLRVDQKDGNAR